MPDCQWCGEQIKLETVFVCNYCQHQFCSDHRLPESHRCIAVMSSDTLGPDIVNLKGDVQAFIGSDPAEADKEASQSPDGNDTEQSGQGDDCPRCGEPAPKGFTYCTNCRNELSQPDAGTDAGSGESGEEDEPPSNDCDRCSGSAPEGRRFCHDCRGELLNREQKQHRNDSGAYESQNAERSEGSLLEEDSESDGSLLACVLDIFR